MNAAPVKTIVQEGSPIPTNALRYDNQLLMRVLAFEAPIVIESMMSKMGLSRQEADTLFLDVKRFLFLAASVDEVVSPTSRLDDGWHIFILCTRAYRSFCFGFFDFYVNHEPMSEGDETGMQVLPRTMELASAMFGDNLGPAWNQCSPRGCSKAKCICTKRCGNCRD